MWMRCWFALIFSLILTLYCQYSHAEQTVDDVLGQIHDVGVSDVGGGGRQGVSSGRASAFGKKGICSVRCTGTTCTGELLGGGGGNVSRGAVTPPAPVNPGATGATAQTPPPPTAPPAPPKTFPEKPSLLDVQGFLTESCTKCHKTTAELLDPDKIRIRGPKGSPMTFAETLKAAQAVPAMAKVMADPNVVKAFETWKNLP